MPDWCRRYVQVFVSIRPLPLVAYEHMFPRPLHPTTAQCTRSALALVRSFLLLEDDVRVDWEVDWNEPTAHPHAHRVTLRGRARARRPGTVLPAAHVCICPVRHPHRQRRARPSAARAAPAPAAARP